MRIDEISLGQIGAGIKGAIAGSKAGTGATAGFNAAAQAKGVQQNTQAVANAALTQWNNKVLQLMQANQGQPISDNEYNDHLKDFLQKTMLGNRRIDYLDINSQGRIDQAIDAVMKNRNNKTALSQSFQQLAGAALAARMDPNRMQQRQTGSVTTSPQQVQSAIQKTIQQLGPHVSTTLATAVQNAAGVAQVRSTGNPATDALLNNLGIKTS